MGKLKGIFQITGSVGDLTFCQTKTGIVVKRKSGISAERIKRDAAFTHTRALNEEFGRAGRYGKQIAGAFRSVVSDCADNTMRGRLMAMLLKAIKADTVNPRGQRKLTPKGILMLESFEFNSSAKLADVMAANIAASYDKQSGTVLIHIDPFLPSTCIKAPSNAPYYSVEIQVVKSDFETAAMDKAVNSTGLLPMNEEMPKGITLHCSMKATGKAPVWLVVCVHFFSKINGKYYPLKGTCASIVKTW